MIRNQSQDAAFDFNCPCFTIGLGRLSSATILRGNYPSRGSGGCSAPWGNDPSRGSGGCSAPWGLTHDLSLDHNRLPHHSSLKSPLVINLWWNMFQVTVGYKPRLSATLLILIPIISHCDPTGTVWAGALRWLAVHALGLRFLTSFYLYIIPCHHEGMNIQWGYAYIYIYVCIWYELNIPIQILENAINRWIQIDVLFRSKVQIVHSNTNICISSI